MTPEKLDKLIDNMKLPLGGPAWLRAKADEKDELFHLITSPDPINRREDEREIIGLRDAATRMEYLELTLEMLDKRVHSNYDFNADPDKMTLRVSRALS
jgi:hypothetical protein